MDETNPDLLSPPMFGWMLPTTDPSLLFLFLSLVLSSPLFCSLPSLILYGVNEKAVVGRSEVRLWRGEGE